MNLKQQDIYIILKLLALRGGKWTYAGLSGSLLLSASEANAAVKRATQCGLMRPALGTEVNPQPIAAAVLEFLAHGIRYVFPAQTGGLVRGVVTGFAAPGLENLIAETGEPVAVWPSAQGAYRGYSLSPLYHRAPEAVQADPRFHAYLALADVLREASARGRETAVRKLGAVIGEDDPTSPLGPTPQTP